MQGSKQHHTRSLGLSIGRRPNVTAFDTPRLPSQRATKGRKSRPFGVYRKVLADRVAAKSFSKHEIVKGIACDEGVVRAPAAGGSIDVAAQRWRWFKTSLFDSYRP